VKGRRRVRPTAAALAFVTGGLFRYTAALAKETKDVVRASKDQFDQAEKHHRQGLSGIVSTMFAFASVVVALFR
jgi:hypothetical protein